ncbi:Phage integrase family protein [Enhydrobacter aerosaccus]|uniref:Phage integrase family protein n=1 Tax=Enhydrobacter aerosaccus TaxID=225324 RepID=A0A1T4RQV3_9HYPH|nr:tyrosine-type recombinase/integrase [Enhydrobacter aerosaccus]SKA18138.1 Phage integrase family protein [Enhydrobacter aerosaccus]
MAKPRHSGFQADVTLDGKRLRPSGFRTEAAAKAWEYQAKANHLVGKPLPPMPSEEESTEWGLKDLLDWAYTEHWAKMPSADTMLKNMKILVADLGANYPAVELLGAEGYRALEAACLARGNSGGTINRKASLVSKALKLAIEQGKIQGENKPQYGRKPEAEGREYILSPEIEARCAEWLGRFCPDTARAGSPEMLDWFTLCIDTGMRVYSETLHVYPHVDVTGRQLVIRGRVLELAPNVSIFRADRRTKTTKGRFISLTERSKAIIERRKRYVPEDKTLFHGTPLNKYYIYDIWQRMNLTLKVNHPDFVPYSLRHTCLTRLFIAGNTMPEVMDWAGHTTPKQTWRYAHLAGILSNNVASKLDKYLEDNKGR